VQNLLEFSRPASAQKQTLDVNSLVERTLQLHDHSLRRNSVEVQFQPQANLPSVLGDANQIIQVLLNLVSNAEHAIREVRETGRIQIRIGRMGDHISVTVQDDGVGISPEALPRIFDPFFSTKRPGGGTGLGLSICMSIIREHGGSIDVETLPAGGTAFTVYLPVATEHPQSGPSVMDTGILTAQVMRSASEVLKDRFVLVLDDEESIRMLLDEGLSAHGLHIDCAATPELAIDLAGRHHYDAVLCDLNLSSGGTTTDGLAVCDRILSLPGARKPAIILMTGELVDSEEVVVGGPLRLQKPFRISEVLTALREAISAG
jgi:CheY-like chemotaxis protein/anti-sigma regulatory factor (Ser/Thr protein kinase)